MGLTVGLVKKAFSKTKSLGNVRNGNERNGNCIEKGTWKLRKLTFCGDYPDPLLHEEKEEEEEEEEEDDDDAGEVCGNGSVDSFGPTQVDARNSFTTETATEEFHQDTTAPIQNSEEKENAAANIIQSAFRGFLTRNRCKLLVRSTQMMSPGGRSSSAGEESMSMSASPKIQAGGGGGDHSPAKALIFQHKVRHNKQQKTQILTHVKEWDDSTLSSNMSKLRIQNKLEATTRRERALAYAFSQQLRSSSSKKRATNEPNLGWSLLERWMATRLQESSSVEDYLEKKNADKRKPNTVMLKKHVFDATTAEEKESCGSNDVPLESTEKNTLPAKNRGKQKKGKLGSC